MAKKKAYPQSKRNQAQLKAEAERKKRNRLVGIICAVLVLALILVVIVVSQLWSREAPPTQNTPPNGTSGTSDVNNVTATGPTAGASTTGPAFIPPNGSTAREWVQVPSANIKPDAIIVDERLDYQCPGCKQAADLWGDTFHQLAVQGDIVLRFRIRTFLDPGLHNDSSTRAAVAATCADVVGRFIDYHETIFANQPASEGVGYTDQQLRVDFAAQAGINGSDLTTFQHCYDTRQTLAYVQAMEQANDSGGTPALFANSKTLPTKDLYTNANPSDTAAVLAYLRTVATS